MGCLKLHTDYYKDKSLKDVSLACKNDKDLKTHTVDYKFGFNGKEQDNEVSGQGNTIAFEERIYDSRLGRFFSTDPWEYKYAWQTPYAHFKNSPIAQIDFMGKGDDPDKPKKKRRFKDPNGSTFLADDIKKAAFADEKIVNTTDRESGEKKTAKVAVGSLQYFDTEDGTRYAARYSEVDGVNQFKGYFDKDNNKYQPEYTYGPIVMQTNISVETNKETGVQTATMTVYGNEQNVWNNTTFTFVVPKVTAIDPTSVSKSVSVDGTYTGQLFLKKTDQDIEKMLQNITISATSSSIGIGRNQASVGVRMNTLDGKKYYKTLFYGMSTGLEIGVGVGGLPIGPFGAGGGSSSGVSVGDTARPLSRPTLSDSINVYGR